MSTITIDGTYAADPRPTGVSVYSRRLIESLAELHSPHHFRIGYRLSRWRQRQHFIRFGTPSRNAASPSTTYFQEPWTFWLPWQAELFHSLAQRPAPFRFRREVVTILDVFPLVGRGYSSAEFQRKFSRLLLEAAGRADLIITPSEYTANELVHIGAAQRGKIRVIPLGVDAPPQPDPNFDPMRERERWAGNGNELILAVGVVQKRKNTIGALRALCRLPARYHLVLVGGDGYGHEPVHDFIRTAGLTDRVHVLGYVDEPVLTKLYRASSLLLFPSFEEGFGLPVLEAMAHGLPVVASNGSSLPEVGGDAACYVDPHDDTAMASAISRAIEDVDLRNHMIIKGLYRAEQFTWRRTAECTMVVYNELLRAE